MSTYDGYTECAMLDVLAQRCITVKLESVEVEESDTPYLCRAWRLYCMSHEFGEFEETNESLFHLLYTAFQPHKPFADEQREQMREMGEKLKQSLAKVRDEPAGHDDDEEMKDLLLGIGAASKWRVIPKPEKDRSEVIECPKCQGRLHMFQSSYNGHVHGKCETEDCLQWME